MKYLFFILCFALCNFSRAETVTVYGSNCRPGQIRFWTQGLGYVCSQQYVRESQNNICPYTPQQQIIQMDWLNSMPSQVYQKQTLPWWASQGSFYYPNFYYPGAWSNNGVNGSYYPGEGQVYALKPNVYVESIHQEKKFTFSFTGKESLSFLAMTPAFHEGNSWKGKIVNKDRFEIEDIHYDYLFYDIRFPKEKMQFERGTCATRDETIKWMLNDLKEMKYPAIALQDFEEHWKVKIPDYPFYCIYPQYNAQLDEALPVQISLEHTQFIRSLFVLVPYKTEPDVDEPQAIPFPILDSSEVRPSSIIKHENMFKEWGVAFLEG